jgi:putative hydrolase of the HAD superfamily
MRFSKVWVFDLDNTLHNASPHIFPRINTAMTAYLAEHLGLGEEEASALRRHYWQRYGATLTGLIRHHGTDPHHFLNQTHPPRADLPGLIVRERALRQTLRRLPGRKVVFSNAPLTYARAVLDALGIRRLFEGVFSIEQTGFRPKPDPHAFLEMMRCHHLTPRRCIMVEDSLANLRTAKKLGMTTVWVTRAARAPGYVDHAVRNLLELPRRAALFA